MIWEVSALTRYVKQVIEEDAQLRDVWVEGEVSNFSISMAGHAFFTLKDASSQLRCVMFRPFLLRIKERPANGERAVARGPVRVYEAQGAYQLYAEFLAPAGLGEAQLQLEELLARLDAEGLFEPSRKRPLPAWPRRVGVVTSATGAVIHDIRTVIGRRYPLVEIVLAPTPVQGDDAVPRICAAIGDLNLVGGVDVIILARGGGSREDLAVFNEEAVARAIFASRAPVVSAIGHETDTTVADLVADHRAPTPSAAAEMVVPDVREVRARLDGLKNALSWRTRTALDQAWEQLAQRRGSLHRQSPLVALAQQRSLLTALATRAEVSLQHRCQLERERLKTREARLVTLDPVATLRRGFSVCYRLDSGVVVRSLSQVLEGDRIETRLVDGAFESRITGTRVVQREPG